MSRSSEKSPLAVPSSAVDVPAANVPRPDDLRCHCGSLLARLVPGGVELKCRRCKRTVTVPLTSQKE
jgi:hypothetical protein